MQVGRRSLLLSGSILGLLADFIVAVVFAVTYTGGANLPESASVASIVLVSDHAWHSNVALSGTGACLRVCRQIHTYTCTSQLQLSKRSTLSCRSLSTPSLLDSPGGP